MNDGAMNRDASQEQGWGVTDAFQRRHLLRNIRFDPV
jgi:hypothetical protein